MEFNIIAKNFDLTKAISDYVQKKLKRMEKYFYGKMTGHITLTLEKNSHLAECFFRLPSRKAVHLKARGQDVYSAVDILMDHVEESLRRLKEKVRDQKRKGEKFPTAAELTVFTSPDLENVERKFIKIEPMTFKEAVRKMEERLYNFWIYLDPVTFSVHIAYKRSDGGFGLIEPLP
ncbi:MAG TPA: ribosome-associated translation inhibitor RaiA [bacterium]|nr:ribosome-associated translation inhibitor RaiA [bacterium]